MNVKTIFNRTIGLAGIALIAACDNDENETPAPTVRFTQVSGSGDITTKLSEFRTLLGDPLNTTPNQTAGRREVN